MQLPLSASALVVLGAGAVLAGALILIVVAVRRRKPASRANRVPPDMRTPQQFGSHGAAQVPPVVNPPVVNPPVVNPPVVNPPVAEAPAVDVPVAAPQDPARFTGPAVPMPSEPARIEQAPAPVESPVSAPELQLQPQPLAAPVAAAAAQRPAEASGYVEPPRESAEAPSAQGEAPQRHHQSGSGRTVAAAVAQAFAVRAAASRGAPQRPADPPPPDGAEPAAGESTPVPPEPAAPAVDEVDPAATTDPDGQGFTAAPAADAAPEPAPEQGSDVWAVATAAQAVNGPDHGAEGNGKAPEGWRVPEPAPDGQGAAEAPAAAPAVVAPPVPAEQPEPTPRPDAGTTAQDDNGPAPDARDRLLAVLLDDPQRAVGAAVDLESCLRELDRLSDAVRTGRTALRDVLVRLSSAGLRPEQLARLARLPQHEVEELLAPA